MDFSALSPWYQDMQKKLIRAYQQVDLLDRQIEDPQVRSQRATRSQSWSHRDNLEIRLDVVKARRSSFLLYVAHLMRQVEAREEMEPDNYSMIG